MKPILFIDFDGTLCHDRFWRSLPSELYAKTQEILFGEDREQLNAWMKGKKTAEEINAYLADLLGIPYEELWNLFVKDSESMNVSTDALEKIQKLRDRYTTILITVNMDNFSRFTVPALELNRYFDTISNSYNEGIFKSDNNGELFRKYLAVYGPSVAESVVIDDSPRVCATFTELGGTAYLATKEQDLSYHLNRIR